MEYSSNVKKKHSQQLNNLENNPCFKEQNMSLNCMDKNNYDPEMCELYFQNYKNCREFWHAVQRHRRINGIKPFMPSYDERQEIKGRYQTTGKI